MALNWATLHPLQQLKAMGCMSSQAVCRSSEPVGSYTLPDGPGFHKDYHLSQRLGRGAFGSVYLAWRREDGDGAREVTHKVAVKAVDLRAAAGADGQRTLVNSKSGLRYADIADTSVDMKRKRSTEKEAQILRSLPPSQFVIAYYADYCEGDIFYLVMELCSCSFLHALDKTPQLTESTLQRVFTGMLWGLVAIHAARVVHRDVKADNYLAVLDGSPLGFTPKLCDFGLAATVPDRDACTLSRVYGTAPYMAPEMLRECKYGAKVDVWALGVLAHVLLFGSWPYTPPSAEGCNAAAIKAAIAAGVPEPTFRTQKGMPAVSPAPTAWLRALLRRDPRQRLSAETALTHPGFAADWEDRTPSLRPTLAAAKRLVGFDCGRGDKKPSRLDALLFGLNRCPQARGSESGLLVKRRPSTASDVSTSAGSIGGAVSLPASP